MRAQNLTISIPSSGCDRNCPYCVSKMTGYPKYDPDLMNRNKRKVIKLADVAQVTSVLFTSKGEPCQHMDTLLYWMDSFQELHTELQTNGNCLDFADLRRLYMKGLNVLAFSFDQLDHFEQYSWLAKQARLMGMITRVTLNVTDFLDASVTFATILKEAKTHKYHQLSLRKITVPNGKLAGGKVSKQAVHWIKNNVCAAQYEGLMAQMSRKDGHVIRKLPFGAIVYDIDGIAVTGFDYCVQDSNNNDDIRSLIFLEDGHLYTSWNSNASILF